MRERLVNAIKGKPQQAERVAVAIEFALESLVADHAERAAESASGAWRAEGYGELLAATADDPSVPGAGSRSGASRRSAWLRSSRSRCATRPATPGTAPASRRRARAVGGARRRHPAGDQPQGQLAASVRLAARCRRPYQRGCRHPVRAGGSGHADPSAHRADGRPSGPATCAGGAVGARRTQPTSFAPGGTTRMTRFAAAKKGTGGHP